MIDKLFLLWMLVIPVPPVDAQVSIGIGLPHVSIGINLPLYPDLEPIPGYPVYYAPQMDANYFFYDGMYWVYQDDNWYASSWYNGPWGMVGPAEVPLFILRVPVRYYRQPPTHFRGWYANSPPRWDDHWGHDWSERRSGWDRWNRKSAPRPAPLPVYQREYAGDRYPGADRQRELRSRNYRYEPRDAEVRQRYHAQRVDSDPRTQERLQAAPRPDAGRSPTRQADPQRVERDSRTQERLQAAPRPESAPQARQTGPQRQQREDVQRQPQEREKAQPRQQDSRERDGDKDREREKGSDRERGSERERAGDRNQDRGR